MATTNELLIVFKTPYMVNGTANLDEKSIKGVQQWGLTNNPEGDYYFVKNDRKSFLPRENILFFGCRFDWEKQNE